MKDKYKNFQQLREYQIPGRDFEIETTDRRSPILVIAPHGGRIELYTTELAQLIAGDDFSFYSFKGTRKSGNMEFLHITSHCFDEPRAIRMARLADIVLAIHGKKKKQKEFTMVGGRHESLCCRIKTSLTREGFAVELPGKSVAAGHPSNICNRGRAGKGVQLELSLQLRQSLQSHPQKCQNFAEAVRSVLLRY
ncbi:poly-gamma-glutamate hydrolase family protein [Thermodesulfobacteriota bacterium]